MPFGERIHSFNNGIVTDDALDFSKRSSFNKEIMLERIYPTRVIIPMKQHYGDEVIPTVGIGEHVLIGQCVGMPAPGTFAVPVHSGISGDVTDIKEITLPNGTTCKAVYIKSDRKRTFHPSVSPRNDVNISASSVMGIIKDAGIVGMGGEGIPTIAKINRARMFKVNELLVNCLQSEPYADSDFVRIDNSADYIVMGAVAVAGAVGVSRISFLISEDRKEEILALQAAMERTAGRYSGYAFNFKFFRNRFPQGYYRLVAKALYGVEISETETLEETCSAVLFNCSTLYACWEAISDNMPLVARVLTVTGEKGIRNNVIAPIGTPLSELMNTVNGMSDTQNLVIWGNCLTGLEAEDPDNTPVVKTTSGITILPRKDIATMACIHCGDCSDACPMDMEPGLIHHLLKKGSVEEADLEGARKCISCGACSYICPSGIDLTKTIASYAASKRTYTTRTHFSVDKIKLGAVSLLEAYEEEEKSGVSKKSDDIVLPFEGGKIV